MSTKNPDSETPVDLSTLKPYDWQFALVERHRAGEVIDPESEDGEELPFAIEAVEYWEKLLALTPEEQRAKMEHWDRIQEKSDAEWGQKSVR
jgi:hypothetical protein